jgi:mono/diheme cytochrome c family protein
MRNYIIAAAFDPMVDLQFAADFGSIAERMKQTIWISAVALIAAGIVIAEQPAGQAAVPGKGQLKGQAKGKPVGLAQSPASLPPAQTVTPQTYPIEQIQVGEMRFNSQCGFCRGRDAAGGETGPDLTRSPLVAEDTHGDKIGPLLRAGRPERGMPSFDLSAPDVGVMVAFIHDQKTKSETLGGGRRSVDVTDLATGNAKAGRRYFSGTGGCSGCHSPTGDLASIASRYQGLLLLQRMLYPSGRPAPAPPKVTFSLPSGNWARGIDKDGRPIPDPAKQPSKDGVLVAPNESGATNFRPPSFDPKTQLFIV